VLLARAEGGPSQPEFAPIAGVWSTRSACVTSLRHTVAKLEPYLRYYRMESGTCCQQGSIWGTPQPNDLLERENWIVRMLAPWSSSGSRDGVAD
jgi:hypothetical protein